MGTSDRLGVGATAGGVGSFAGAGEGGTVLAGVLGDATPFASLGATGSCCSDDEGTGFAGSSATATATGFEGSAGATSGAKRPELSRESFMAS